MGGWAARSYHHIDTLLDWSSVGGVLKMGVVQARCCEHWSLWLVMFLLVAIVEFAFTVIFEAARIDGYLLLNIQYGSFCRNLLRGDY